jgi:cytochrome c-type biogenesis protein CcsB
MTDALAILAVAFYAVAMIYFLIRFFLKKEKTARAAYLFLLLGLATHGLDLLVIGLRYRHFPATSLSEAFTLVSWLTVLFFTWIVRRDSMEAVAVVLLPVAIVSVLYHEFFGRKIPAPEPIIREEWVYIHIPLMILSVAALALTFVLAIIYIIQERQLKSKQPAFFYYRLPSLEVCEDLASNSLWAGFFLLTLGIVTGMILSRSVHGVYFSWDYKEIWSVITWCLYAILIHGRLLAAWRGRRAAYFAIAGFVLMLFSFAGISLLSKGYHAF